MDTPANPLMAALEKFESAEANLVKLERLWTELASLVPAGIAFGENPQYHDRKRAYTELLAALPKIDDWKPATELHDLDEIAQNRLDALELGEVSLQARVERAIDEPGRELREYRFRFNNKRRALVRDSLVSLIDQVDADLRVLRQHASQTEGPHQMGQEHWTPLKQHVKQIEVLLGSTIEFPTRWGDLHRHMHFGYVGDLNDIERLDWPQIKNGLRSSLYGTNEPLPVGVDDLSELVTSKPIGSIATELNWKKLTDEGFERLIFSLISVAPGYENPEWLMQTRAPDRGRDLSVYRITKDELSGIFRRRVVIQCKHWLSRSVALADASTAKEQMALWTSPRVDVLVIATSGRFTADAITWIESHNSAGKTPSIEMWPESHLERILAARPALIAEFALR